MERLLGRRIPAVWLRGADRLPSLSEVLCLGHLESPSTLFVWRIAALKHLRSGPFEHQPCLARHECFTLHTEGQTSLGREDHPSVLAVSRVHGCSEREFSSVVGHSTFPRLWGAFYGTPRSVADYAMRLSDTLKGWGAQPRTVAARDYASFLQGTRRDRMRSVVVVVDSNMRQYWVVPQLDDLLDVPEPLSFATRNEFERWEAVGWDVKRLEGLMA